MSQRAEDTLRTVCALVASVCQKPAETVQPETELLTQGLDSVRAIELMVVLEDEFRVTLPPDTMERHRAATVAELASFLSDFLAKQ